jgi:hypothetical protein
MRLVTLEKQIFGGGVEWKRKYGSTDIKTRPYATPPMVESTAI